MARPSKPQPYTEMTHGGSGIVVQGTPDSIANVLGDAHRHGEAEVFLLSRRGERVLADARVAWKLTAVPG